MEGSEGAAADAAAAAAAADPAADPQPSTGPAAAMVGSTAAADTQSGGDLAGSDAAAAEAKAAGTPAAKHIVLPDIGPGGAPCVVALLPAATLVNRCALLAAAGPERAGYHAPPGLLVALP